MKTKVVPLHEYVQKELAWIQGAIDLTIMKGMSEDTERVYGVFVYLANELPEYEFDFILDTYSSVARIRCSGYPSTASFKDATMDICEKLEQLFPNNVVAVSDDSLYGIPIRNISITVNEGTRAEFNLKCQLHGKQDDTACKVVPITEPLPEHRIQHTRTVGYKIVCRDKEEGDAA